MTGKKLIGMGAAFCVAMYLAGCGGSDGGDSGEPEPPIQTLSLTIAGKVTDAPIPNAVVTATVGGVEFSAVADGEGAYSLELVDVPLESGTLPVLIEAQGSEGQEFVAFRSQLHSLDTLITQSNDDGVLDSGENIRVNVTHLSTSESVLIGDDLNSDAELNDAISNVDPEPLLDTAGVIKLIVDMGEEYALPDEFDDTLSFASSEEAVETFVEEVMSTEEGAEDLRKAQMETADDADVVDQSDGIVVPARALTIYQVPEDAFNYFNLGEVFEFKPDGTGLAYNAAETSETTWQQDGNGIQVSTDFATEVDEYNGSGAYDRVLYETRLIELVPLGNDLAQVRRTVVKSYPDYPMVVPTETTYVFAKRYLVDERETEVFPPVNGVSGRSIGVNVYNTDEAVSPPGGLAADVLGFIAGGMGESTFWADGFTWTEAENGLSLSFTGGTEMSYRFVRDIDACGQIWIADALGADGHRRIDTGLALCNEQAAFVESDIPGYYYQFGVGEEEMPEADVVGFGLRFDADGTGSQFDNYIETDEDGNETERYDDDQNDPYLAFFWELTADGSVLVRRTYDEETYVPSCDPDSSGCLVWDRRELFPMTLSDGRFYWMEVRSDGTAESSATYLPRFYDYSESAVPVEGVAPSPGKRKAVLVKPLDARRMLAGQPK